MAGRKSLKDEIEILRRYADLTGPYFKVLKAHLESPKKDDQRWAADNLKTAFAKMIPTKIEGDGDDGEILIKVVNYGGDNTALQLPAKTLPASTTPSD